MKTRPNPNSSYRNIEYHLYAAMDETFLAIMEEDSAAKRKVEKIIRQAIYDFQETAYGKGKIELTPYKVGSEV